MSDTPAMPKRKRRWWVRLLRAALLLLLLLVLLLSGSLWWTYSKRVDLLNNALANLGPVQGTVGSFEVTRSGGIELHDLVFTDRTTGTVVARVPHISGQANLAKLPPDEILSLKLQSPEIHLTAAIIDAWRKQAAASPTASNGAPPIPFGIHFARVDIEDARVRFTQGDSSNADVTLNFQGKDLNVQPTGITTGGLSLQNTRVHLEQADGTNADVTLNYHGESVSLQNGNLKTGEQELNIEDASVKARHEDDAPFAIQQLHVKGRVQDGIVNLTEVDLEKSGLHLMPELLAMFGLKAPSDPSPAGNAPVAVPPPTAPTGPPAGHPPGLVRGFRIESAKVHDVALSTRGFTGKNVSGLTLPDMEGRVSYEASGIEWRAGSMPVVASQKAKLQDVRLEAPDDSGHLRLESASFDFNTTGNGTQWLIKSLTLAKPDIRWTPQLRTLLTSQGQAAKNDASTNAAKAGAETNAPPSPSPAKPTVQLKQADVTDALIDIADPELMPFEMHTRGALRLANLLLDGKGFHSQSFQTIEVTATKLVFPASKDGAAKKPWLELPHGEVVVKPDDWNEHTRIAQVALDKIVVRMRDGNTPWDSSQSSVQASPSNPPTPTPPATENREPPTETPPWWKLINFGQLTVNEGKVDLLMDAPKPVDMQAQLDITTQRMENGGSQHTVRVANLTARLPTLSPTPFPVAQADLVEGVVRLPEMWTQRRFDELHLTGASVDLSEALLKLFEPEKQAEAAITTPPPPKPDEPVAASPPSSIQHPASPWQVGLLSVNNSSVTVTNLVPGLPAVKFGLSLEVKDTPLLAEDIAQSVASQRIELHDLKIPSPNGTARYVAELDSIFVTFSLGGLMRKEIDGIEIVSPTLFVGEDLFWYVDFYRKYAERGAQPAPKGPAVAANDANLNLALANAVTAAEPPASQASWSVKRLQVHSGKLVLAPKGVPLKGFHTPFPFHIDSEVTRGTLNADMEIPADTYELPEVNLQFVGMTGRVQFNLPLKQKDNNLVETFEVDSIRWKGIRTGKAFLSVTYDSAGIYSKFGADAYEGYLNGEFNVYTDDSFHWDGWVGGKNVQTHELTRILCPGYFIMDGRVEATLVAQGSKDELYQADGSFKNHTPGTFTIKALNGLIKDLPKSLEPLNAQIAKIGLETLRDFKYDHAEMKCRFYGREGNGTLQFSGPNGSRNFDINVYDHRWRTDEPGTVITSIGTVKDKNDE